ncbi:MAG TPA: amidohydrolase family protein, partial [Blastocatellia bacterium]
MLITNARLITWGETNRILENHALYIEGDRISDLGPSSDLRAKYPQATEFDARGQYVAPGNICAHTHFYGAFARGMAAPGEAPKDFPEILERLWWRLDKALTLDDVRYSALVCLIDAIRHGTTTIVDHHASPNAIEGSLDVIAEAVEEAGLRACLCYEVTDRDGPERSRAGVEENLRFIKSRASNLPSQIAASFGLHASLTLSDATLEACRDAHDARNPGFHVHAAEHEADQYDSLKKSGSRVIDRL